MKIKLSATFEGRCSICGKKSIVFTAGDEDTHKAVSVCKSCAGNLGDKPTAEVIDEYGKKDDKAFEEGLRVEKNKGTAS